MKAILLGKNVRFDGLFPCQVVLIYEVGSTFLCLIAYKLILMVELCLLAFIVNLFMKYSVKA